MRRSLRLYLTASATGRAVRSFALVFAFLQIRAPDQKIIDPLVLPTGKATAGRLELRIPFGAPGRVGASAGGVRFAEAGRSQCESFAGQGFTYAAGQMNACETAVPGFMPC